jgi:hypothetical protein
LANSGMSSVTDVNTGRYDFNFSSNFPFNTYFGCATVSYTSSTYWRSIGLKYSGGTQDMGRTTGTCRAGGYESTWVDSPSVGLIARG